MNTRTDYLIRVIDQMCAFMLQVAHLLQKNQLDEAQEVINTALRQLAGMDPKMLDMFPAEEIIRLFSQNGDHVNIFYMAEFLKLKAEVYRMKKETTDYEMTARKALALYTYSATQLKDGKLLAQCSAATAEIKGWLVSA